MKFLSRTLLVPFGRMYIPLLSDYHIYLVEASPLITVDQ